MYWICSWNLELLTLDNISAVASGFTVLWTICVVWRNRQGFVCALTNKKSQRKGVVKSLTQLVKQVKPQISRLFFFFDSQVTFELFSTSTALLVRRWPAVRSPSVKIRIRFDTPRNPLSTLPHLCWETTWHHCLRWHLRFVTSMWTYYMFHMFFFSWNDQFRGL